MLAVASRVACRVACRAGGGGVAIGAAVTPRGALCLRTRVLNKAQGASVLSGKNCQKAVCTLAHARHAHVHEPRPRPPAPCRQTGRHLKPGFIHHREGRLVTTRGGCLLTKVSFGSGSARRNTAVCAMVSCSFSSPWTWTVLSHSPMAMHKLHISMLKP